MESDIHKKIKYILKHNAFILSIYKTVMSSTFRFIGFFVRTNDRLVLIQSYGGEKYNDSPLVLYRKMKSDDRFRDFHYVWAFVDPESFSVEGADKIKIDSFKYFLTAIKAKIWITNVNIERGLHFKKRETIYLNTWHGSGFKKSGNAIKSRNDYDFSNVDILCCDGEYMKNIFIKYFNAKEQSFLMCGRPREDELFTFTYADKVKIRNELKISAEKKIILFMPTWRDYQHKLIDCSLWKREIGDEYVVLFRTHHFDEVEQIKYEDQDFLIDVTGYDDVNKLYYVSDILISDYSSAFFDFGLLGKPMLCFADDYEYYCQTTGLFMDLEKEFPNGVIKDEKTLLSEVKSIDDYEKVGNDAFCFVNKYVFRQGNATKCCIDKLKELVDNN